MWRFSSHVSIDRVRSRARFLGLNANRRRDFLLGPQLEQIGDRAPLGRASHFGNFVNFLDISAAGCGKKHQVIMRRGGEEMLDEIAFFFLRGALAR